jgi:hypothetical protein
VAPLCDFRMQSFGCELVAAVGRPARTTAILSFGLLDGFVKRLLPRVDLSFARKCAGDSFGSATADRGRRLSGRSTLGSAFRR